MKKAFGARRVPRKIGADDDAPAHDAQAPTTSDSGPSVVKRPTTKPRKSFPVRSSLAFNDDEDDAQETVTTPKPTSNRVAIERNASSRSDDSSTAHDAAARPSYTKTYLQELKQSTPATPTTLKDPVSTTALDITSKFGTDISRYSLPSAIPTEAEIIEKKARRARIAREQDYISLDDHHDAKPGQQDDSDDDVTHDDHGRLILRPKDAESETRLVADDQDMYEGFDDFTAVSTTTHPNRLNMTVSDDTVQQQRRNEISALIATASDSEQTDDDDDIDGTGNRTAAFEDAQTSRGTYASSHPSNLDSASHRAAHSAPPRIAPLPTLNGVLGALRDKLAVLQINRLATEKELNELVKEKIEVEADEVRVQASLAETAERFKGLREQVLARQGAENDTAAAGGTAGAGTAGAGTAGAGTAGAGEVEGSVVRSNPGMPAAAAFERSPTMGHVGMSGPGFGRQGLGATPGRSDDDSD